VIYLYPLCSDWTRIDSVFHHPLLSLSTVSKLETENFISSSLAFKSILRVGFPVPVLAFMRQIAVANYCNEIHYTPDHNCDTPFEGYHRG
jgi:hypothetical protein